MIEGKYWYIVNLKMCLCQEDREQSKTRFYDFNPIMSTVLKLIEKCFSSVLKNIFNFVAFGFWIGLPMG